jgi:hypothetical protein
MPQNMKNIRPDMQLIFFGKCQECWADWLAGSLHVYSEISWILAASYLQH